MSKGPGRPGKRKVVTAHRQLRRAVSIEAALCDRNLLGASLGDLRSWLTWISVLKAAHGCALSEAELHAFQSVAGGRSPPTAKVKELVCAVSRRGGKGRMAAAIATYEACLVDHSAHLVPGEVGVVACISPTRAQAGIVRDYVLGYFESSPVLRNEIADITADEIRLRNGVIITTLSSDYRTLRGRSLLCAVLDEASFLGGEYSMTPDIEAARAILPGLATTGGMLVTISSPYRRAGLVYDRYKQSFGKDDPYCLVVAGASAIFNPTLDAGMLAAARAQDPAGAVSEWDGLFRDDLATFVDLAVIEACVEKGVRERAPSEEHKYHAFIDPSGGSVDSLACAVGHKEGEGLVVVDAVREIKAPFDPESAVDEIARFLSPYRVKSISGDRYGARWVTTAFEKRDIAYRHSELNKSALYLECLPRLNSRTVRLVDDPKLVAQFASLERQTARGGRDSVDHPRNAHDDLCNAAAGLVYICSRHVEQGELFGVYGSADPTPRDYSHLNGPVTIVGGDGSVGTGWATTR